MANKLSRKKLEEIVARDLPDFEIVQKRAVDTGRNVRPDAVSPDIDRLRKKYLGGDAASAEGHYAGSLRSVSRDSPSRASASPRAAFETTGPDSEDQIVIVQRRGGATDLRGPGPKAAVVSTRGIKGIQG